MLTLSRASRYDGGQTPAYGVDETGEVFSLRPASNRRSDEIVCERRHRWREGSAGQALTKSPSRQEGEIAGKLMGERRADESGGGANNPPSP
jgi:hypothetical protein